MRFGDVMRGRAENFDAPIIGLLMGLCAYKRWQEGVMNIDNGQRELVDERSRKHLHVTGQDHQVDLTGRQKLQLPGFSLSFVFLADRD